MSTRVLIVDDHQLVAAGLTSLVESEGTFEVVGQAANGLESVELAKQFSPDLVLMDMMMPKLNGVDAARHIVQLLPLTKIIMFSMHTNAEFVYRALNAGVKGYVIKRSAARELFEAINAVMSGQRFISAEITDSVTDFVLAGAVADNLLDKLSARERTVLQRFAESKTVAQIAEELHLSPKTIETYRARMYGKLGIQDLPALVRFAVKHGLIKVD